MDELDSLRRFLDAQDPVYAEVCTELRNGQKTSHWMWFIFPQLRGLGHSAMAHKFGLASLAEAQAYLQHAVLGPRLRECTQLVNRVEGRSIREILGTPDDMKFGSCMTLFELASAGGDEFSEALGKYFGGRRDARTLERA
jgi:uncharacterized protein (DUF1810 family)